MKRRTFIFSSAVAAVGSGLLGCETICNNFFLTDSAKKSTKIVDQLKWINDHRRAELAQNLLHKKASELNELIPEINSIELSNSFVNEAGDFLRIIAWNTERGRYWR